MAKSNSLLRIKVVLIFLLLNFNSSVYADLTDLSRLQQAYPEHLQAISKNSVVWVDGTRMIAYDGHPNKTPQEKLDNPSLLDQIAAVYYEPGIPFEPENYYPKSDPGRIRYEPFFRKMYGDSKEEVEAKLITIYWMPKLFGSAYPLLVTTVNQVDEKIVNISNELEVLVNKHPEYLSFLDHPEETFNWRYIANTHRLSNHSFGMTIDINAGEANYWQWDLQHTGQPINEDMPLFYRNNVPWEIIPIFEKYGFIWGGKWYHYDSMHFEYRPELMRKASE